MFAFCYFLSSLTLLLLVASLLQTASRMLQVFNAVCCCSAQNPNISFLFLFDFLKYIWPTLFIAAHSFRPPKSATIFMAFGRNFNETLAHQASSGRHSLGQRLHHHWKLNYECDRKLTDFDSLTRASAHAHTYARMILFCI